ncbi:SURF1 family protein [Sedimenticola selenatireducens]|uniref:SURF1 family protein n=1 Tax=Sedimenticola selenatireducens TaxID=191960 RepID=UPI00048F5B6C|nr:SURF1 family protein [Sedimenticola selenatireducens]
MQISTLQFQPRPIPTLFLLLILLPLFLSLGFWQLDRAQQKRTTANTMETRRKLPPLIVSEQPLTAEEIEFRTLSVSGQFVPAGQLLITNRKHLGKPGYHVITPLRLQGSNRHLLVNRGWVAAVNNHPPAIETPTGPITLSGETNIPSPPAIELEFDLHNSILWPFLTLENYRAWSGLDIFPFVILQSPDSPHGFVRAWASARPGEGMHLGYAIQWFAFGLLSLALWLRLSLTRLSSLVTAKENR